MTRLALFLLPYVPGFAKPYILGLAIGRMPRKGGTSDAVNDSLKRALERGR